ncbi:uncharacterized protein TNCV_1028981 [Trichonephila clavipes]|nr:uncharacterized protein TNCV_1028981 [Trichonephila clavipes]
MRPSIVLLEKGSWEPLHQWQHMWLQDVMDIPLGCHVCVVPRINSRVREDIGAPSEGATFAWMMADEEVGRTRVCLMMWWSSRRLVCRGHPEPGLHVNDISRIHWSQHILKTISDSESGLIDELLA